MDSVLCVLVSKVKELRRFFFYCWQIWAMRDPLPGEIKFSFSLKWIKRKKADVSQQKEAKKWLHRTATTKTLTSVSSETIFLHLLSLLLWPDFSAMGSTRVDFDVRRRLREKKCTSGRRSRHDGCRTCCVETFSRDRGRKWAVYSTVTIAVQFFFCNLNTSSKEWNVVEQAFSIIWALIEWLNNNTHTQQIVGSKSLSPGMGTTRFFLFTATKKIYTVFSLFAVLRCTRSIFTKFNYSARKNWKSIKSKNISWAAQQV